jgi:hypothetical protein
MLMLEQASKQADKNAASLLLDTLPMTTAVIQPCEWWVK